MNPTRNFLLIITDQWRGDCLSYAGHPVVETPTLDELASKGVYFRRAYSPSPSCIPARACLATGQTPWHCGRTGYQDKIPWDYAHTMMHLFRDSGYQTINVGKTHFFPQRSHLGFEINRLYDPQRLSPGFESDYHRWLQEKTNGAVQDTAMIVNNNTWVAAPWDAPSHLHPTEWTAETAIQTLKDRDPTRPFFMQVGFHRPHPPYDPPAYYYDMYKDKELPPVPVGAWAEDCPIMPCEDMRNDAFYARIRPEAEDRMRRAYFGSITHIDAQIARIFYWLVNNRLYDDTTIIFTSDHGELLGDHHMFRKANPWEGSSNIPMIVKPAKGISFTRGLYDDSTPVSLIDIMPTFLSEAGIPVPADVDGVDLGPALEGDRLPRSLVHGEHSPVETVGWQYLTDGRYKYIWETLGGAEWLFDLHEDPSESVNIIDTPALSETVAYFRRSLAEILSERDLGMSDGEQLVPGTVLPPFVGY